MRTNIRRAGERTMPPIAAERPSLDVGKVTWPWIMVLLVGLQVMVAAGYYPGNVEDRFVDTSIQITAQRYLFWLLGSLALIAHLAQRGILPLMRIYRPFSAITIVFALATLVAIMPAMSFKAFIIWLYISFVPIAIALELPAHKAIKPIFWYFFAVIAGSVLVAVLMPSLGQEASNRVGRSWRGVMVGKNQLGWMAALAIAVCANWRIVGRTPAILLVGLSAICLVMSFSQGGMVSAIVVAAYWMLLARLQRTGGSPGVKMLALAGLIVVSVLVVAASYQLLLGLLDRDPTLTGRTEIWRAFLASAYRRPVLGWGLGSFTGFSPITLPIYYAFRNAGFIITPHNMYIAQFGETGGVGLIVLVAILIYFMIVFPFRYRGPFVLPTALIAVAVAVGGVGEAHPLHATGPGMFLLIYLYTLARRDSRALEPDPEDVAPIDGGTLRSDRSPIRSGDRRPA